jgi:SAM-dependent methyltransferase
VSGFTADWLRLREPADAAARAADLIVPFARNDGRPLRIIDLGAGTGANLRYLAPRLGGVQEWLAVDDDPQLLAALVAPPGLAVRTRVLDLARSLDALPFGEFDLVTASALLDLVSAPWLARLAGRCAAAGVDVLFALTYDGRIDWTPAEADDDVVRSALNRHQTRDKGFGPALGPSAAREAVAAFTAGGYEIRTARSDWVLGPDSAALQAALVHGWTAAAAEIAPETTRAVAEWAKRRLARIAAGDSRLRVGHVDFAGRRRNQNARLQPPPRSEATSGRVSRMSPDSFVNDLPGRSHAG